jgi:hypothetical protein
LIGQFFRHVGKFKRNPVAFLNAEVVRIDSQFFCLVAQPIAFLRHGRPHWNCSLQHDLIARSN